MMWLRTIWFILTLRCEEADRLRSISHHDELTRSQRVAERVHRSLCANCRRAAAQLEQLDRVLDQISDDLTVTATPGWDEQRAARLEASLRRGLRENGT